MNTRSLILISLCLSFTAQANPLLISKAEIRQVVGAYPEAGSADEAQDDSILLEWQDQRTEAECLAAAKQSNSLTLKSFFGDVLTKKEINYLSVRLLRVAAIAAANSSRAKSMYDRPRPYDRNGDVKPCIDTEKSSSYPSGHTTLARLYGRVLSLRYPSRAEKFMARADQAALNRVLGGVHHPSDIEAGKRLGDYLAKKFYR
jgi:acid phosphatase (class A)